MGPDPKILDDIARVAGGAVNIVSGLQQQMMDEIRTRMDDMAAKMDLVPREDLERAEAMIAKLRQRQDDLEKRLAALEGKAKPAVKKTAKKAAKKTAAKTAKKTTAKKTVAKKTTKKKKTGKTRS